MLPIMSQNLSSFEALSHVSFSREGIVSMAETESTFSFNAFKLSSGSNGSKDSECADMSNGAHNLSLLYCAHLRGCYLLREARTNRVVYEEHTSTSE